MGKKSRKKRERRGHANSNKTAASMFKQMLELRASSGRQAEIDLHFQRDVAAVEAVLRKYVPFDAAVALAVSD